MSDYYYIDIGVNFAGHKYTPYAIKTILQNFYDNYGEAVISISNSIQEISINWQLSQQSFACNFYYTAGCHPHNAKNMSENDYNTLRNAFSNSKCLCIGEIGLDFNRNFSPKNKQIEIFEKQLLIAKELNKPVYLHCRDAYIDFIQIIKKVGYCNGVVHCFTGNEQQANELVELGFKLGITGWLLDTRRNADLIMAVKSVPLTSLMVETDAPFMALKGQQVSIPNNVSLVIKEISKLKNINVDICGQTIYTTTKKFFGLP